MLFAVTCYVPKHLTNVFEHRLKFCRNNFVGHKVNIMRRGDTIAGKPNVSFKLFIVFVENVADS